jgi:hypothetical protein
MKHHRSEEFCGPGAATARKGFDGSLPKGVSSNQIPPRTCLCIDLILLNKQLSVCAGIMRGAHILGPGVHVKSAGGTNAILLSCF